MKPSRRYLVAVLLLVGCTSPQTLPANPGQPPAELVGPPGTPVTPPLPTAPAVVRRGGQVRVADLGAGAPSYLWSPDGSRVAFQDNGGLWTLSPDGQQYERLADGSKHRDLVGWTEAGGLVYLEATPDGLAVAVGQPGSEPRVVTVLAEEQVGAPGRRPLWRHLAGSRLVVAAEGLPVWHIDVASGAVRMLSETPLPVHRGNFAVSPDGRTLAFKLSNRGDHVRLLDLESGAVVATDNDGAHLPGVAWAPAGSGAAGSVWAVRGAAAGSGLPVAVGANAGEGATHLVVGDASGRVRRLEPPEPLQLIAGPMWSRDGRWLAVTAGVVRGMRAGQPSEFRPTGVWLVEVESGRWQRLGDLTEGWVAGWHPAGRHLLVQAGDNRMESWPLDGGPARKEPHPWWHAGTETAVLLEDGYIYLTAETNAHRVMLVRGEAGPVEILGGEGFKSQLTIRGDHMAVVDQQAGARPALVLIHLPSLR